MTEKIHPALESHLEDEEQVFTEHPEEIEFGFLNQFHDVLPGGLMRTEEFMINEGQLKDYREFTPEQAQHFSEQRLNQTDAEFFATIDAVIDKLGLDAKKIKSANAEALAVAKNDALPLEDRNRSKRDLLLSIADEMLTIYKELRKMGYTHYELIR